MRREIQLGGNAYSIGRLTAKQQFHVSRRIAPIIPPLIPLFMKLAKTSGGAAGAMAR